MTNFSCEHDRSTVYPLFRAVFQNMHKHTCQPFKVFMLKINFTTILFKSNTKFSGAPNVNFRKISVRKTIIIWDLEYNILFWNLSLLLGLFNCRELANLSWNFITTTSKQHSKTMRCELCCEKLGTSHDVKSFAEGSFLERFVVKIANNYLF